MKRLLSGFGFVLLAGCLPTAQPNQIIVDGEASLEFEPEIFSLTGAIRARSDTQAGALAEISDTLASIRDTMPNLEGLTHLTIDAASAALTPIQNPECMENRRYNDEEQCPIEGYFGSIGLSLEGSPANLSGQALSLLSELGAESVSLSGYSLVDRESAQKDALDAAVRDARGKADNIAQAAAATVIGPIRVQYGEGFP
ncbi:MAG: SIMPL domain-containing protein, partial [Pseudomonadota bacterium]